MPPRTRRSAAEVTDTAAGVTVDSGVATENVVRDPADVPRPPRRDVVSRLAVENVVVEAPTEPQGDHDEDAGGGDSE